MTFASLAGLLFRVLLGGSLAFGGFYMAIEEQHKVSADRWVEFLGVGLALLGLFTAPYAGDALANGGKKLGQFGRRSYDQYAAAKRGDPVTEEAPTVQVTVNEVKQ